MVYDVTIIQSYRDKPTDVSIWPFYRYFNAKDIMLKQVRVGNRFVRYALLKIIETGQLLVAELAEFCLFISMLSLITARRLREPESM